MLSFSSFILLFLFLTTVQCQYHFIMIYACAFNPLTSMPSFSNLDCGMQCSDANCQIFQFNTINLLCSFYSYSQICKSQNSCYYTETYLNTKFMSNMIAATSPRYQILKNINFQYGSGTPSTYTIINSALAFPIVTGPAGAVIIGAGQNKTNRLVAWPNSNIINIMSAGSSSMQLLTNNIVAYLTSGQCTSYYNCYHSIDNYTNFIGVQNLVFGVLDTSVFDSVDFLNQLVAYQWHVIVGGNYIAISVASQIKTVLAFYGFCPSSGYGTTSWKVTDNICSPVHPVNYGCNNL